MIAEKTPEVESDGEHSELGLNWRCRELFDGKVKDEDIPLNSERPQQAEGRSFSTIKSTFYEYHQEADKTTYGLPKNTKYTYSAWISGKQLTKSPNEVGHIKSNQINFLFAGGSKQQHKRPDLFQKIRVQDSFSEQQFENREREAYLHRLQGMLSVHRTQFLSVRRVLRV